MKSSTLVGVLFSTIFMGVIACNDGGTKQEKDATAETQPQAGAQEMHGDEIKPGDITLTTPLQADWVTAGKAIYDVKCQSCHKLTGDRVVGPGWKDVTKRREPHWIMNMITNVDMMLEKDPEAQKLLEQCLVRMPNQNLSKDEARQVLEFMRSNDGVK